jgi:hypothetical protein
MLRRAAMLSAALVLVVPVLAWADSKLRVSGDVLYLINDDAGIANRLVVENDARGRVRFYDDADPRGMAFETPPCTPGQVNGRGNPIEVFCSKDGSYHSVSISTGPAEDRLTYKVDDMPTIAAGGDGADTLTAAAGADTVAGGQGDDTLDGGAGNDLIRGDDGNDRMGGGAGDDTINGGPGNDAFGGGDGTDTIQSADGYKDAVDCGAGDDGAVVDQLDELTACERVTRQQVTPVPGQGGPRDTVAPTLAVGGSTSQRPRRSVKVLATSSEPAKINASGYLAAGGVNRKLKPAAARVAVGGGGVTLRLRMSKSMTRRVKRDLRRRRRPRAFITVSAVDSAGNTSRPRRIVIGFRR